MKLDELLVTDNFNNSWYKEILGWENSYITIGQGLIINVKLNKGYNEYFFK